MRRKSKEDPIVLNDICYVLFESAAESMVVVNEKGNIFLVNPKVQEMFGYEKDELIGKPVNILVPEKFRKKHMEHQRFYQVNPEKRPMGQGMELYAMRKDGTTFPVDVSLTHFNLGERRMVMALVSDITKRISLYDELKKNVRFLVEAEEMAQLGHYEIDILNGGITWSRGTYNIFEIEPGTKVPSFLKFVHMIYKADRETVIKLYKDSIQYDRTFDFVHRIVSKTGAIKYVHSIGYVNDRDENGKPIRVFGILQDISGRKRTEEVLQQLNTKLELRVKERTRELEDSQQLYKMIARNFPNGTISVFDKKLNYVFAEGRELFKMGITSNELIGTNYLERLPADIREETRNRLMMVFKAKNCSFEIETNKRTYLINAVAIPDAKGVVNRILVVEQNITQLKKAEEDIRQALKKEKYLNEFKSRFVSMASHEFRTPLTSVLSSVSLLSKNIDLNGNGERQLKHIERIKSSVNHLTNILNDFLALDKLEEGKMQLHPRLFNIEDLSREVVTDIVEMSSNGHNINYKHNGPADISLDKQMITNILNNLLSNAVKYSPKNEAVELSTGIDNNRLRIQVKDYGIGIPDEEQKHLFDRFFRAKNALNIQGTGLGLNIVRKYVEWTGGEINFKSKENEGTTFTVDIPLVK